MADRTHNQIVVKIVELSNIIENGSDYHYDKPKAKTVLETLNWITGNGEFPEIDKEV